MSDDEDFKPPPRLDDAAFENERVVPPPSRHLNVAPPRRRSLRVSPVTSSTINNDGACSLFQTTFSLSSHVIDRLLDNKVAVRTREHERLNICPCTQFGYDREIRYPHHFFCHECSLWEKEALSCNLSRIDPISRRWRCHASHDVRSIVPTQGQKHHHSLVSPGEYNGQPPESTQSPILQQEINFNFDNSYFLGGESTSQLPLSSDDESSVSSYGDDDQQRAPSKKAASSNDPDIDNNKKRKHPFTTSTDSSILTNHQEQTKHLLSVQQTRITDLENKLAKLCQAYTQLKKQKSTLMENIEFYYSSKDRASSSNADTALFPARTNSDSSSRNHGTHSQTTTPTATAKDCSLAATHFLATIQSYNTLGKTPKAINRLAADMVEIVWNESVLQGSLQVALLNRAREWLSKNDFAPHNVLRAMDLRGGVLNFEGVEILRHCETKGKRFIRNTVIPSTAALQRAASVVQQYGQMRFPMLHQYVDGIGENIRFRPLDVIRAAVRLAGLEEAAKRRRIQVAESRDGAKFSKYLNFVMFGIKNQDLFARDPESGELVSAKNIQSASNVWPVDIIMGKEGTNLIQNHLRELFVKFEHAASTGVVDKYDWMPIQDATNADMNAVWKSNEFGCATKTRGNAKPCHCCLINNDDLVLPNEDKTTCRWCTSSGAAMDGSR